MQIALQKEIVSDPIFKYVFRVNCRAVLRAIVPNNGSVSTEAKYQGLTFKTNFVPGEILKSLEDLDNAYWTLLGENLQAETI